MISLFDRILEDPSKFTFLTETLGECKIDTPIANTTHFVDSDDMYSM